MSALDIGARGLAARAHAQFARTDEGAASLAARSEPTAAALEALASEFGLLTGVAGSSHTVESDPFITRQGLVIRGNGAELRNVNPAPLDQQHTVSGALNVGVSTVWETPLLTYHPVVEVQGTELVLGAGAGNNFAEGHLVILHGATKYTTFYGPDFYDVFRNYLRARVVEATADRVTLDRGLPVQLVADDPVIANADEGMVSYLPGAPRYYLLHAPHLSNLTLVSEKGEALQYGGVIDGVFRDLVIEGRNGIALNAMQDCLFDNVRFRAWRKICELAEGSFGTRVRGMRGTLSDPGSRFGGESDAPPFFISVSENSAECLLENFDVSSGMNTVTGTGAACLLGSGRDNEIRNSILRFPAHTRPALALQSRADAGNSNLDCGFRNVTVHAPVCSQFLTCNDGGAGIVRPFIDGCRFFGAPTLRAARLDGTAGRLLDTFFENGDVHFAGPSATDWRVERNTINGAVALAGASNNVVRGNFIRDGFTDLSAAGLRENTVEGNESAASRRLDAASLVMESSVAVTTTTANAVFGSATFGAGDLAPGDRIFFSSQAGIGSSGTTNRFARASVTSGSVTTGIGSKVASVPGLPIGFDGVIEIRADTSIVCDFAIGGELFHTAGEVSSIEANGLSVNLEYWVSNPAELINVRAARIIPVKPGMRHLPVR